MTGPALSWVEWGVAGRPRAGIEPSGDRDIVVPYPDGVLLGVADGLGHGSEAAVAADAVAATCLAHAESGVCEVIRKCHDGLRRTRGAVVGLAALDRIRRTVEWAGIGNIEAIMLRARGGAARETLVSRNGVVGYRMPTPKAAFLPIEIGDLLIFATDGIAGAFAELAYDTQPVQQMADSILDRYGKRDDDALTLVARFLGGPT